LLLGSGERAVRQLLGLRPGDRDVRLDPDGPRPLGADRAQRSVGAGGRTALPGDPVRKRRAGEQLSQRRAGGEDRVVATKHAELDRGALDQVAAAGRKPEHDGGTDRRDAQLDRAQREAANEPPAEADGDRNRLAVDAVEGE
jgi:hypothetical protein